MPAKKPSEQTRAGGEIRSRFWESLDAALDAIDVLVARRFSGSVDIMRAAGFSRGAIRRETRRILDHTDGIISRYLAGGVSSAANYAQAASDATVAWQISAGIVARGVGGGISPGDYARAKKIASSGVDSKKAVSGLSIKPVANRDIISALDRFGAQVELSKYSGGMTSGVRAIRALQRAGIIKRARNIGLSSRLHGSLAYNRRLTNKAIKSIIRESAGINKAGRDLISAINDSGSTLAANRRLTKPLMRLRRAARALQAMSINSSDQDALREATAEFNRSFDKIKKIASARVDARGAYLETVQRLKARRSYRAIKINKSVFERATQKQIDQWVSSESARRTEAALKRWLDEKQAYHAETIIETETAAAYRAREAEQHINKPYISGFWWRRNPGMVALDLKRRRDMSRSRRRRRRGKKARRKTPGRPCGVCPQLADRFFPPEYAREYPRGAHPLCRCWFEWEYDKSRLDDMPITESHLEWFRSLPD